MKDADFEIRWSKKDTLLLFRKTICTSYPLNCLNL